jgi:hypothetical protein
MCESFPAGWRGIVLLALVFLAACSGTAGPMAPVPQTEVETARVHLLLALEAADAPSAEASMVSEARIRLPGGEVIVGREQVMNRAVVWPAEGELSATFLTEGVTRCTGALEERGWFTVAHAEQEQSVGGRYLAVWEPGPAGPVLREAAFRGRRERGKLKALCQPVSDSVFRLRGGWVALHLGGAKPLEGFRSSRLNASMLETGWGITARSRELVRPELTLRLPVGQRWLVGGNVQATAGTYGVLSPRGQHADFEHLGIVAGLTGGAQWGSAMLVVGPSVVHMSGAWWGRPIVWGGIPGPRTQEEKWRSWAVGPAVEASVVSGLSSRIGVESRLQYRYFPEMAIPGYLGSDPLRVGAGGWSATVGLGTKLW